MLPDSNYVLQRAETSLHRFGVLGFGVDADQRLGAARSQQDPAAVGEVELEPVVRPDTLHGHAPDLLRLILLQRLQDSLAFRLVRIARQMDVVPAVSISSAKTWRWLMKRPVSSMMPTRSASPSVMMHRSWPPTFMTLIVESMLGGIGSGFIPPNSGLR